ncbi:hypothetical protein [Pedobacter duraquae]|uniref:hypothetical protein n=1 Tax=Pedobacter duraquae TaxID=425511 RepID=UPI00105E23C0|nr:hypothetical protein [Pedobacter duraquae]
MFDLAKSEFKGEVLARNLKEFVGTTVRVVGKFVCDKTVRTKRGDYMKFGTFFDVNGDFFDTVHFPPSLRAYPIRGSGIHLIEGKVVTDFDCPAIEVSRIAPTPVHADRRSL